MKLFYVATIGLVVIGMLVPSSMFAKTLYVALDGSDDQPGSEAQPFRTIQHAVDQAEPGDTIRIGPGTYYERVAITRSGEEGALIVLEGARGEGGERLTRVEAGEAVDSQVWQPAPEVGPNVYQTDRFAYEPNLVTLDGRFVAHAHRRSGRAMEILAWPTDHREPARGEGTVPVWQVLGGAVYAYHPEPSKGITYLRLPEGTEPGDYAVAISPGGAVIAISNASHIVLRGLAIASGETGVLIEGATAEHNIIDDCYVVHGRRRVHVTGGAAHNTVQNSRLEMGFFGAATGPWAGGTTETEAIRGYIYTYFKYLAGPGTISDDRSIIIDRGAKHTTIAGNHFESGLTGIVTADTEGVVVRDNVIRGFSSVGIVLRNDSVDIHLHDNTLIDSSINIRLHTLNMGVGHRVYIYRNRLSQPEGVGTQIFCHFNRVIENYPHADVAIYHNTILGGRTGWAIPAARSAYAGLPGFRWLNNVVATDRPVHAQKPLHEASMVGLYDYNMVIGRSIAHGIPEWFGQDNIVTVEAQAPYWHSDERMNFDLPPDSLARQVGVDLSQPFVIDGQTYEPLPGMEPGYYHGDRPDMGAIQHN